MRVDADVVIPGRGEPIPSGAVVIEGDRIAFVGGQDGAPGEPSVHVPALLPGLWDTHGHLMGVTLGGDVLVQDATVPVARRAARSVRDLRAMLDAGITSVREVGGLGIDLRNVVAEGAAAGPSIYAAGQVLSPTGGHTDVHGYPWEWLATGAIGRVGIQCDGVAQCLRAVRLQLRAGADMIKVCASGGVLSELDHPIHQQFSREELSAIVDEAGRAERAVAAHCHGKPGIMAAVEAGVTTIEHGSYLDEEAAQAMREQGAILVPTRFIVDVLLGLRERLPDYSVRKLESLADRHLEAIQIAIDANVTIAMGTDSVFSGLHYGLLSREILLLVEAGMTPLAAIEAATATGPRTLGPRAPRSGLLTEGYAADVIALDADPVDDLTVWGNPDRVTHVWKAGEPVKEPRGEDHRS